MTCNCNKSGPVIEVNSVGCQQAPCCASTPTQIDCNCNVGESSVCGCTIEPASSTPFYAKAPGCQESHKRVVVQNTFTTGLVQSNIANMPAVGYTVTLIFPGLVKINIGSLLWHPSYGYLEVKAFDYATCTVIAENTDRPGNAAPGTLLPQCTLWQVVDNPEQVEPCNNNLVEEATVLGCADGEVHPLTGQEPGQLLTLVDAETGVAEYTSYDLPELICTELTLDLTLLAGNIGPYTATVDDSSVFTDCPLSVIIGCSHTFVNVNILSPTTISIRIDGAAPVANETYVAGTQICCAHCCDNLEYIIEHPCDQDWSDRVLVDNYYLNSGTHGHGTILKTGEAYTSPEACLGDIGCNDGCKPIQVVLIATFFCSYEVSSDVEPNWAQLEYTPRIIVDVDQNCPTSKVNPLVIEDYHTKFEYIPDNGGGGRIDINGNFSVDVHRVFEIAAGKGAHVCAQHKLEVGVTDSANTYVDINHMDIQLRVLVVSA